jgi:hypothetical protein
MTPVRTRRPVAALLTGVLAVASLTVALVATTAAPAQALPTGGVAGGTATWGISTYINSANPGRPNPRPESYALPSTFDAATRFSTWGTATGTVAPNASATLQFDGTTVNYASTSGSWLKIADPEVALDTDGNGTVTAMVSYGTAPGSNPVPYDDSTPTRASVRINVFVLSGNTAAQRTSTSAQTTWTGLTGAWSPDFIDFLDGDTGAGIAGWPYSVTFTGAVDRLPSPITFSVNTAVPDVDAAITGSTFVDGVTLDVDGTGFRAVTTPGDAGVYVGLAESGGLPDVSTPAGMAAFAASAYVLPGQVVDGAFSKTLNAATEDLDSTKTYSIYTWQAHTHSNTTQDTVTPVAIDFSTLEPTAGVVTPGGSATKVYGATSTLTATVNGGGSVTLTGVGASQTRDVASGGGTASFTVPADLAVGSYTATFAYSGSGAVASASATKALTVTKATPTLGLTVKKKPTTAKRGKVTVTASGPAGVAAPSGEVTLKVSLKGVKHTLTGVLVNGVVTVKLPKLTAGSWKVKGTYPGSTGYAKATFKEFVIVK